MALAMCGTRLSQQDKKDLDKFTKFLIYKSVQIIVQSRLGYKVKTQSKPFSSGSDWFNLAIRDIPDVLSETKRALSSQLISVKQSLCVEISLKTADGDTMILEVWSLGMLDQYDPNVKVSYMVYNRMGVLLKSLFCVSRVTPAYRLSRSQGPENYVICYRMFLGEPSVNHLGDGQVSRKVGSVPTPIGKITLSVSYRTKLLISPQHSCRDLGSELKENHFKSDSPKKITQPKPCKFSRVRERSSSEGNEPASCGDLTDGPIVPAPDTQEASLAVLSSTPPDRSLRRASFSPHRQNYYYKSQTLPARLKRVREDRAMSSSRSPDRMSSFTQGQRTGAFAPARTPDELRPINDEIPFAALYRYPSTGMESSPRASPTRRSQSSRRSDRSDQSDSDTGTGGPLDQQLPGSNNSSQMSAPDDFVMVELKTPFASSDDGGPSDLGKFYRDCQGAPSLAMFDNQPTVDQTMEEITEQIAIFEAHVDDFDDFVDNLEVEQ